MKKSPAEDGGTKLIISSISTSKDEEHSTSLLFFQAATRLAAEQPKALFVCFQIAINDSAVQLSVKKNSLKHKKTAKKAAKLTGYSVVNENRWIEYFLYLPDGQKVSFLCKLKVWQVYNIYIEKGIQGLLDLVA
jgi:hypothetical protein